MLFRPETEKDALHFQQLALQSAVNLLVLVKNRDPKVDIPQDEAAQTFAQFCHLRSSNHDAAMEALAQTVHDFVVFYYSAQNLWGLQLLHASQRRLLAEALQGYQYWKVQRVRHTSAAHDPSWAQESPLNRLNWTALNSQLLGLQPA